MSNPANAMKEGAFTPGNGGCLDAWQVSVSRLAGLAHPLRSDVWGLGRPLDAAQVRRSLREGAFERAPCSAKRPAAWHARRIAWLMHEGWRDPISLDVGCPSFPGYRPGWLVVDGNHRLAAAILRRDRTIAALVDGEVRHACELLHLPVPADEPSAEIGM